MSVNRKEDIVKKVEIKIENDCGTEISKNGKERSQRVMEKLF